MKSLVKLLPVLVMVQFTIVIHAQNNADSLVICTILQEEIDSWNRGDAVTYSGHFAEDGTFTNILGLYYMGYDEFLSRHDQIFKGIFRGTTMQQTLVSLKFISPDVTVVETLTYISGFSENGPAKGTYLDEQGRLRTRLLQVMVREGSDWKISAYHNVDIKPGVPSPEPF